MSSTSEIAEKVRIPLYFPTLAMYNPEINLLRTSNHVATATWIGPVYWQTVLLPTLYGPKATVQVVSNSFPASEDHG
jgi:hypothetical protein